MAKERTEKQIDLYNRYGSPLQWLGAAVAGTASALVTFVSTTRTKFHDDSVFRQGTKVIHAVKAIELEEAFDAQISATMKLYSEAFKDNKDFNAFAKARDAVNELERTQPDLYFKPWTFKEEKIAYSKTLETWINNNGEKIKEVGRTKEFKGTVSEFLNKLRSIKSNANHVTDQLDETLLGMKSLGTAGHTVGAWQRLKNFGAYSSRNVWLKMGAAFAVASGVALMAMNQLNTRDKLNELDKQSEDNGRKVDTLLAEHSVPADAIETKAEHAEHAHIKDGKDDKKHARGHHSRAVLSGRDEADISAEMLR